MAIRYAGWEDQDFETTVSTTTTAGRFRAGYARGGLYPTSGSARTAQLPALPGSFWLAWQMYTSSGSFMKFVGLCKYGTLAGIWIGTAPSSPGKACIYSYIGSGSTYVELAREGAATFATGLRRIDVQIINWGATGTIVLYCDGVELCRYTGDLTVGGLAPSVGCLGLWGLSTDGVCSEVVIADEDTRAMVGVVTGAPNAAGDADPWSGTVPSGINAIANTDAAPVYTNTPGQDELANLSDLPAGLTVTVRAVRIAARVAKGASSAVNSIALGTKQGAGQVNAGQVNVDAGHALPLAYALADRMMDGINPATGAAWQQSEINPLQVVLRSLA